MTERDRGSTDDPSEENLEEIFGNETSENLKKIKKKCLEILEIIALRPDLGFETQLRVIDGIIPQIKKAVEHLNGKLSEREHFFVGMILYYKQYNMVQFPFHVARLFGSLRERDRYNDVSNAAVSNVNRQFLSELINGIEVFLPSHNFFEVLMILELVEGYTVNSRHDGMCNDICERLNEQFAVCEKGQTMDLDVFREIWKDASVMLAQMEANAH